MLNLWVTLWVALQRDERGISALEYAVLAAVLIGLIVLGVTDFGTGIQGLFSDALTEVQNAIN